MEWLRCNKCYRAMKTSKQSFLLTQCGHVYCAKCAAGSTKCPECGAENFTTMMLSYPPKLEMTHNYFASLDSFMEIGLKTAQFQDNQLAICLRGFEQIEQKYENMKRSYWSGMEQMTNVMKAYQKLVEEVPKLEKIRESLSRSRQCQIMSGAKGSSSFSFDVPSRNLQGNDHGRLVTFTEPRRPRTSGSTYQYGEKRSAAKFSTINNWDDNSNLRTPQQAYNPNVPFTAERFNSDAYASDSGVSSVPESSSSCPGVFRVPSRRKVPRSVASLERRTPTSGRLTEPKIGFSF